ncbi:MAG: RNA methyltransferase [Acidobacteriota bacterium]
MTTAGMAEEAPAVILVEPQLANNIGGAARAMLNCGLGDLRLVAPRDGWPNDAARPMASGADRILDAARCFATLEEATEDLHRLYATTARHRDMTAVELTPRRAASEIHAQAARGARAGILFGRERIGLTNEEVTRCEALVVAPLNPEFTSLNLAQAVLLIGWEWRMARDRTPQRLQITPDTRPATRREHDIFFDRLEESLEQTAFFREDNMRPVLVRKIRSMLLRAEMTEQDVRIMHGILSALEGKRLSLHQARGRGGAQAGEAQAGEAQGEKRLTRD